MFGDVRPESAFVRRRLVPVVNDILVLGKRRRRASRTRINLNEVDVGQLQGLRVSSWVSDDRVGVSCVLGLRPLETVLGGR